MSSYDLETRRLLCCERVDQLRRDARTPPAGRRKRRRWRVAFGRLAVSPAAYRASRASVDS